MKSRIVLLLITWLAGSAALRAQDLVFQLRFGAENLEAGRTYFQNGDSITITACKFYVSGIEFISQGKSIWKETNSFHLIDMEAPGSLRISGLTPPKAFDAVRFNLGIDSATNVSGAMGGDLDPASGMYWSWQSGYINFKLEGQSRRCQTRHHEFTFHLGGYLPPDLALQTITLPIAAKQEINIVADLGQWMQTIDLARQNHLMSPGPEAVRLMKVAAEIFKAE